MLTSEIRLHKRFHMFDFIYYNNIIFHGSNLIPLYCLCIILPLKNLYYEINFNRQILRHRSFLLHTSPNVVPHTY
jgi:hypothetical protein